MKHKLKVEVNGDSSEFIIKTEGDGTVEGIVAFLKDIISHPEWKPGHNILLDHRDLRIDKITVADIEEVSKYFISIGNELGTGKIALIMKRDIDFGIARAWELATELDVDIKIRVFRKIEDANNWLKE